MKIGSKTVISSSRNLYATSVGHTMTGAKRYYDNLEHILGNPQYTDLSNQDWFGVCVAISGNYALVGASEEDTYGASGGGVVWVYDVLSGRILYPLTLSAYGTKLTDHFGRSLDVYGNYAIVGAYGDSDGSTIKGTAFILNITTGQILHTLTNPNYNTSGDLDDYFGYRVSINNKYVAVSAMYEDSDTQSNIGITYVYGLASGELLYRLECPNPNAGANFGSSVDMTERYLIVGAKYHAVGTVTYSGTAYVYDLESATPGNDTSLVPMHTIENPNPTIGIYFADGVAINPNYFAISNGDGDTVEVYNINGTYKYTLTNPVDTSGDSGFGQLYSSIAISDKYIVVGAYNQRTIVGGTTYYPGGAHVFDTETGSLIKSISFYHAYTDSSPEGYFGNSVDISGEYVIIGAYKQDDTGTYGFDTGAAFIYTLTECDSAVMANQFLEI